MKLAGLPLHVTAAALAMALAGCGRRAPDATPEGAVKELVERLGRMRGEPAEAKAAFELLSKRAKANMTARAKRYSDASGKNIAPEAMIAPSRFQLRFDPQRYTAEIAGTYARVNVLGARPDDHAQVPCVLEETVWRVDLALPALPPVQMRPGSGSP